jgi:hypothetical protein
MYLKEVVGLTEFQATHQVTKKKKNQTKYWGAAKSLPLLPDRVRVALVRVAQILVALVRVAQILVARVQLVQQQIRTRRQTTRA